MKIFAFPDYHGPEKVKQICHLPFSKHHLKSGSRIYVYQYDPGDKVPNLEHVKNKDGKPWNYKTEPGISTLASKFRMT